MDEPDLADHEDESESSASIRLARVRLWTRTVSSQQQEPIAVDEVPATPRIVDFSSIAARNNALPTLAPSTSRNPAREANHTPLTNGHTLRASARSGDRAERTRALLARYGIEPEDIDWTTPTEKPVQRVERTVRMRIRFWCHRCSTQYTNSRTCAQCAHQRCNRCVREPPRRSTPRVRLADAARTSDHISAENLHAMSAAEPVMDAVPPGLQHVSIDSISQAHISSGREPLPQEVSAISQETSNHVIRTAPRHYEPNVPLVPTNVRVRLRHTCHECLRTFSPRESTCSACGHERCKECPTDPPRSNHSGTDWSTQALDPTTVDLGSKLDGNDQYEKEFTTPEASGDRRQNPGAQDTVTSPLLPAARVEGIGLQDMTLAPLAPPPPG